MAAEILVAPAEPVQVGHHIDCHGRHRGSENAPDSGVAQAGDLQLSAHLRLQIRGSREDILHALGVDRAVVGQKVVVELQLLRARGISRKRVEHQGGPPGAHHLRHRGRAQRRGGSARVYHQKRCAFPRHPVAGYAIALAGAAQNGAVPLDRAFHLRGPLGAQGVS